MEQVNVFLRITRKREDGYHDLASLFHVRFLNLDHPFFRHVPVCGAKCIEVWVGSMEKHSCVARVFSEVGLIYMCALHDLLVLPGNKFGGHNQVLSVTIPKGSTFHECAWRTS